MKSGKHISTMAGAVFGAGLALAAMPGISEAYTSPQSQVNMHIATANLYTAATMHHPSHGTTEPPAKPTQEELNRKRAEHKDLISLIENPNTTPEGLVKDMQKYSQPDYYKAEAKFLIKARKEALGDNFNGRATPAQAEEILTSMEHHRNASDDLKALAVIGGLMTFAAGLGAGVGLGARGPKYDY